MESEIKSKALNLERLIFGCASLMNIKESSYRQNLLENALENGLNHFDVSPIYGFGECEKELGKFLRNKHQVKVTTKFGLIPNRVTKNVSKGQALFRSFFKKIPMLKHSAKSYYAKFGMKKNFNLVECERSLKKSISNLKKEKIDILLMQDPLFNDFIESGIENHLDSLKKQGLIDEFGVTGNKSDISKLLIKRPLLINKTIQVNDDIFRTDENQIKELSILNKINRYSIMRNSFPKVKNCFDLFPNITRYWSDRLNFDLSLDENLNLCILAAALELNKNDKIIFSTLKIERLNKIINLLSNPNWAKKDILEFGYFFGM